MILADNDGQRPLRSRDDDEYRRALYRRSLYRVLANNMVRELCEAALSDGRVADVVQMAMLRSEFYQHAKAVGIRLPM